MTTRRSFLGALAVFPVAAALPSISDPWSVWAQHLEQGSWILVGDRPALFQSVKRGYVQLHTLWNTTVTPEGGDRHYLGTYNLEHRNSKALSFRYPRTLEANTFYDLHIRVDGSGSAWVDSAYITPSPVLNENVVASWATYNGRSVVS